MAGSLTNNLLMCFLYVTVLFLIGSTVAITEADIKGICSKARKPSFCLNYLIRQQNISTTDFTALAKISIESVHTKVLTTSKRIQSLVQNATNPKLKEVYTSCTENYDDAVYNLDDAKQSLVARDFASVNIKVSAAMDDANTCLEDLKTVQGDLMIVKRSKYLENVCGFILVLSNMLVLS